MLTIATLAAGEPAGATAVAISAAGGHTCAVTASGGVKCWGSNLSGELGNGTQTGSATAVAVVGMASGVASVVTGDSSTGSGHSCALTNSGGVRCWGSNAVGQLGNSFAGTISPVPVNVVGLASGVTALAAGSEFTCALTVAGGVKCWGYNAVGQLGDGTLMNSSIPVDVAGLAGGVVAISAGEYHACALTSGGSVKCWGWNLYGQIGDGSTTDRATPVQVVGLNSGGAGISAGGGHSCAVTDAGAALCWGNNFIGELGDGTTENRPTPVPVSGLASGVSTIEAGAYHTCALSDGGGVKCWGAGDFVGNGLGTDEAVPVDVLGLTNGVVAISASSRPSHTCALTSLGTVACWGDNAEGQLGDGTATSRLTPTSVLGLTPPVDLLSVGGFHACFITNTGTVKCWGENFEGQLGDGTYENRRSAVDVSGLSARVVKLASGGTHSCALTDQGGVECWGGNGSGQLGEGTTLDRLFATSVIGLESGVADISCGESHTCAVMESGVVKCWGENGSGALGDGTTTDRWTPVDVVGLLSGAVAVAAGDDFTCALTRTGGARCWGRNDQGELGDGTTTTRLLPVDVVGLSSGVGAVAVGGSAGQGFACAITSGGGVKCWGRNESGELGDGTTTGRLTPVEVAGLPSTVAAIDLGSLHSCALTSSGAAVCWGDNGTGEIGDGTQVTRLTPTGVSGLTSGIVALSAAAQHSCALTKTGAVKCWGYPPLGGSGIPSLTPEAALLQPGGWTAVTTGAYHACGLTTEGGVKCWGDRLEGKLGDGTISEWRSSLVPVEVTALSSGVTAIEAGAIHTCALTEAGGAKCWGGNYRGQVGDGSTTHRPIPTDVPGLTTGVASITGGDSHTCALTDAGGVKCWGWNAYGQLGDGTTQQRLTPVDVAGLASGVVAVSAGTFHTCALTDSGQVKCWGGNQKGQLGDGTKTHRAIPVEVAYMSGVTTAVSAGSLHTCALTIFGTARCWGDNSEGQLGDGTLQDRSFPFDVSGLTSGVQSISGRQSTVCALRDGGVSCWGVAPVGDGTGHRRLSPEAVIGLTSGVSSISISHPRCALSQEGILKCWGTLWGRTSATNGSYTITAVGAGDAQPHFSPVSVAQCGDSTRVPAEECDDGNLTDGDCCSASCTVEGPLGGLCRMITTPVPVLGGTVVTPDGAASIVIPPGVLTDPTSISIQGQTESSFNLGDGTRTAAVASFGPDGAVFSAPVTVTMAWLDTNDDGIVDGTTPALFEGDLRVWHDGVAATGPCSSFLHHPGSCTACCDPLRNTWTFQTTSFSEFAVGAVACSGMDRTQLKISGLNKPGNNSLSLKTDVVLTPSALSGLDPLSRGVRILLSDANGRALDLVVPGGAYDRAAKRGWKQNGAGTAWTYIDGNKPNPLVPSGAGITKVVIKSSSGSTGSVSLKVSGKKVDYSLTPPLLAQLSLDGAGCFATTPTCLFNPSGTTLLCR